MGIAWLADEVNENAHLFIVAIDTTVTAGYS